VRKLNSCIYCHRLQRTIRSDTRVPFLFPLILTSFYNDIVIIRPYSKLLWPLPTFRRKVWFSLVYPPLCQSVWGINFLNVMNVDSFHFILFTYKKILWHPLCEKDVNRLAFFFSTLNVSHFPCNSKQCEILPDFTMKLAIWRIQLNIFEQTMLRKNIYTNFMSALRGNEYHRLELGFDSTYIWNHLVFIHIYFDKLHLAELWLSSGTKKRFLRVRSLASLFT